MRRRLPCKERWLPFVRGGARQAPPHRATRGVTRAVRRQRERGEMCVRASPVVSRVCRLKSGSSE